MFCYKLTHFCFKTQPLTEQFTVYKEYINDNSYNFYRNA